MFRVLCVCAASNHLAPVRTDKLLKGGLAPNLLAPNQPPERGLLLNQFLWAPFSSIILIATTHVEK